MRLLTLLLLLNGSAQLLIAQGPPRGNALQFDGMNDVVDFGNVSTFAFDYNTPFSVQMWVNLPTTVIQNQTFFSKFDGGSFDGFTMGLLGSNGKATFSIINFSTFEFFEVRSNSDLRTGQWEHLTLTYDGTGNDNGATLYVNGKEETQVALAGAVTASVLTSAPTLLGNFSGGNEFFRGQMDEVRIWSRALTPDEVRETMHLTPGSPTTVVGLLAYYPLNETSGTTTITDATGTVNGTLMSFDATTAWQPSPVNVGDDAGGTSQAVSRALASGTNTTVFPGANLTATYAASTPARSVTATYQNFPPNSLAGVTGLDIYDTPVWTVNSTTAGANDNLATAATFTYPSGTFTSPTGADYALYQRTVTATGAWSVVATAATQVTGSTITFGNIDLEGQFLVARTGSALPVRWLSFEAARSETHPQVRLDWQTAREVNHRGFAVERATDGRHWQQIGFVSGGDPAAEVTTYAFVDTDAPEDRVLYYRLQQQDWDGRTEYSAVRVVSARNDARLRIAVFPNPSSGPLFLRYPPEQTEQPVTLRLYDAAGNRIWETTQTPSSAAQVLHLPDALPSAVYRLLVYSQQGDLLRILPVYRN